MLVVWIEDGEAASRTGYKDVSIQIHADIGDDCPHQSGQAGHKVAPAAGFFVPKTFSGDTHMGPAVLFFVPDGEAVAPGAGTLIGAHIPGAKPFAVAAIHIDGEDIVGMERAV